MIQSQKSRDLKLEYKLHQQDNCFGLTENAILPKNKDKEDYKPRTLIDQTLELIDPTPNIHTLFVQFNEHFFWNVLLPVEVKWSPKMTSCAGICTFHPRNRQCIISLSAPLLKLRPRKDLVETLLHEMIHGYLFLTNNNRDRDGHGPEFCKHMNRINKAAGTKITIYHNFHDEVRLYQQHWWRCNGPCQKKAPYFGTVRRAMNRAPGPSDFWWKEHQQTCGGQFIKIKEPENFKTKSSKSKEKTKSSPKNYNQPSTMFNWLMKTTSPITESKIVSIPKSIKSVVNNQNSLNGFKRLGTGTNNVHGWGTGGPNCSSNSQKYGSPSSITKISSTSKFSSSGVVGGSNTGQSNLLNKLYNVNYNQTLNKNTTPRKTINSLINAVEMEKPIAKNSKLLNEVQTKLVKCPICDNFVPNNEMNKHIDFCLSSRNEKVDKSKEQITIKNSNNGNFANLEIKANNSPSAKKRKNESSTFSSKQLKLDQLQNSRKVNCPICSNSFNLIDINEHIDKCLLETDDNLVIKLDDTDDNNTSINESIISISSASSDDSFSFSVTENSKNASQNTKDKKNNVMNTVPHNCLVCNEFIPFGVSLNDHLEDCIGNVFNDDISSSIHCNNSEMLSAVPEVSIEQNKYPCPVCMKLIIESQMNQHLDVCLTNT
ncbi:sprT-like domain-containing protein Spartan [Bombus bifarius]|uniref:Protein with SprT-like domain at the N terminus n=1 Tax=Bombus bifarius TaxID=103933 RepID=A0A6P8MU58_9HYME|nr:sprT-like domain-containing protein Spartan [Bombus bifarius]